MSLGKFKHSLTTIKQMRSPASNQRSSPSEKDDSTHFKAKLFQKIKPRATLGPEKLTLEGVMQQLDKKKPVIQHNRVEIDIEVGSIIRQRSYEQLRKPKTHDSGAQLKESIDSVEVRPNIQPNCDLKEFLSGRASITARANRTKKRTAGSGDFDKVNLDLYDKNPQKNQELNHKELKSSESRSKMLKKQIAARKEEDLPLRKAPVATPTPVVQSVVGCWYYRRAVREAILQSRLKSPHLIHLETSFVYFQKLRELIQRSEHLSLSRAKKVQLPVQVGQARPTLLFDIDETLVHCDIKNETTSFDKRVRIMMTIPPKQKVMVLPLLPQANVNIRPYAGKLLKNLSKQFEIGVFTAAAAHYAREIVNILDPDNSVIKFCLSRENCYEIHPNVYIKDLRVISNRDLKKVFLVDNAAYSYAYQLDNGIPIVGYYEGKEDEELRHLEEYLVHLGNAKSPLHENRHFFKNYLLHEENDVNSFANKFNDFQ